MLKIATVAIAIALLSMPLQAVQQEFEFDKSHADITFSVLHLGFADVHGRFNEFDGTMQLDPDDISNSAVQVDIKTASISTFFEKRDTHLKSADFFDVENHPSMRFTSTAVVSTGENTAQLVGELTILGITKPVTLELTINKIAPHPRSGKLTAGATAKGTIKRSEWGLTTSIPGVSDEVKLVLDMEARVKDS